MGKEVATLRDIYDGYEEFVDCGQSEDQSATYRAQDRLTRKIDRKRAAFLASGEPDDYCPFAPVEGEEGEDDEVTQ